MRNLWKRVAAVVLAASMVLQGIPVSTVVVETVEAAEVTEAGYSVADEEKEEILVTESTEEVSAKETTETEVSTTGEEVTEVPVERVGVVVENADEEETVVVQALADSSDDVVANGICGSDLTWILDSEGTLIISGTGNMNNYSSGKTPWYEQYNNIKKIIIETGVTSIGEYSFYGCSEMTSVAIPDVEERHWIQFN